MYKHIMNILLIEAVLILVAVIVSGSAMGQ